MVLRYLALTGLHGGTPSHRPLALGRLGWSLSQPGEPLWDPGDSNYFSRFLAAPPSVKLLPSPSAEHSIITTQPLRSLPCGRGNSLGFAAWGALP